MPFALGGVIPPLVTPRDNQTDTVDTPAYRRLCEALISRGVHGLFANSSTGEAPSLDRDQRRIAVEAVAEAAGGRVPVLAGVGAPATAQSIGYAKDAVAAGATHIVILPFHLVPLSREELYDYFAAVADSVDIPTLLYNYPQRTGGQNIPVDIAGRLHDACNVIGIKDSSGDFVNTASYLQIPFSVFAGPEALFYPLLAIGGAGCICSVANYLPEVVVSLYSAFQDGDAAQARELQRKLLTLKKVSALGTFPASMKAAVQARGLNVGDPFPPTKPLSNSQIEEIAAFLSDSFGAEAFAD